jgi:multidrug resistance efflux pump
MSRRGRNNSAFSLFAFQDIITSVTGIMVLITLVLALELLQRKESAPAAKTAQVTDDIRKTIDENKLAIQQLKLQLEQSMRLVEEFASIDITRVNVELTDLKQRNESLRREIAKLESEQQDAKERLEEARSKKQDRSSDPKTLEDLLRQLEEAAKQLARLKKSNRVIFNPSEGQSKSPWLVEIADNGLKVAKIGVSAAPATFDTVDQFKTWAAARRPSAEYFVLLVKPSGIDSFANVRTVLKDMSFDLGYDLLTEDQNAIDLEIGAAAK